MFGFSLSLGDEFRVNTTTSGNEFEPGIGYLSDGDFVVAWIHGSSTIFAQRYDATGTAIGTEFLVNVNIPSGVVDGPSVSGLEDGGFLISWSGSVDAFGLDYDVFAQKYDASGQVAGSNFTVNASTADRQQHPSVAGLSDGGFVISWDSLGQDGDLWGVFARQFDASGSPIDTEFQVNSTSARSQLTSSVTELTDDRFVIVWNSEQDSGSSLGIFAQLYDAMGNAVGTEFQVNTTIANLQWSPSIATLSDGGFVVTWQSEGQDGSAYGVYAQRFDADANFNGNEFRVNTYAIGSQESPSVASLSDGGFVISWMSQGQDGDLWGIFGQTFDNQGAPLGSEFQINSYTINSQYNPAIRALDDNTFVVAWNSRDQDGTYDGVYARIFDIETNIPPVISSGDGETADIMLAENALLVTTVTADDPDGDTLTYSLAGGADLALFEIDSATGALSFKSAPDYEAPVDAGNDNVYDVIVQVSDGDLSDEQAIMVTVTNVDGEFWTGGNQGEAHTGTGEEDIILGNNGKDILNGDGGNDILSGGNGNDVLNGGMGNDHLFGDRGNDIFVFEEGSGVDVIHDFASSNDKIDISGYGVTAGNFETWAAEHISGNVIDFDGGPNVIDQLTVMGVTSLGVADFILWA